MSVQLEKIFGYILLAIGLVCISYAILSMRDVYTEMTNPPEIFKMQSLSITTTPSGSNEPVELSIALGTDVRKAINLFLYYMLMVFMLLAGTNISGLGIQLIKEIKVKIKDS